MPPPPIILELVEHFGRNADVYRNNLNETEVRVQFIDPLFEALGWDVHNKQRYAETYKDVLHEYSLRSTTHTEAPDYCFQVGGTRKFYVEAKRPAVNLYNDVARAFQLRSYACDVTGDFCTSGSEREFTLKERWYANQEIQAGAGCDAAAAD